MDENRQRRGLPHIGVYTRLRPSKVHKGGVGVFAICNIDQGESLFSDDTGRLFWIHRNRLTGLPKQLRKLYEDFPVVKKKGTLYGCPKSFNQLTVAWYLNHSRKKPNVVCDKNYNFFAKRDIKSGEELTVDYFTYNEFRVGPKNLRG
jgi:SET domain-containing protein